MTRTILGIDPGAAESGLVVRHGDECLGADVIAGPGWQVPDAYLDTVLRTVDALLLVATAAGDPLVAVEGLVEPNPHLGLTNVRGLIGTAIVLGALRAHLRGVEVLVVAPGGHGQGPLRSYPAALVGPRETGSYGTGRLRHARSAWDVAGAARFLAGLQALAV